MTETTQKTPLKWFYFLIYFALIFGPIINVISGITNVTGFVYTMTLPTAEMPKQSTTPFPHCNR